MNKTYSPERDGGHRQTASADLTNDYATSLETKLDNGFALAGGHTNAAPAYSRALPGDISRSVYIAPVSSMPTPGSGPVG